MKVNIPLLVAIVLAITICMSESIKVRKARRLNKVARKLSINFSCAGRPIGYYADMDFGCRVFHICDNFGRRIPMRCPKHTRFNQMFRVCDWEDNVDCAVSDKWYHVNEVQLEREHWQTTTSTVTTANTNDP